MQACTRHPGNNVREAAGDDSWLSCNGACLCVLCCVQAEPITLLRCMVLIIYVGQLTWTTKVLTCTLGSDIALENTAPGKTAG
jgi:hypothetical protein